MKTGHLEDWRKKCDDCEISDSCFVKHYVSYCSGVIDVKPLIAMLADKEEDVIEAEVAIDSSVVLDKCPKCGSKLTMWFSNYIDNQRRYCRNIESCNYSETRPIPEEEI